MAQWTQVAAVALCGCIGVLLRYAMTLALPRESLASFPFSTFAVNCIGCFFAGFLFVFAAERGSLSDFWRNSLMIGLLGGFTTFSSYALETVQLISQNQSGPAILYFLISPVLCVAFAFLGVWLTRLLITVL